MTTTRCIHHLVAVLAATAMSMPSLAAGERAPEQVFRSTCSYCHGHMVAPGVLVAPVLQGRQLPAALVSTMVRQGGQRMPPFRPTEVTEAELAALSTWLEASPAPAPGAPR